MTCLQIIAAAVAVGLSLGFLAGAFWASIGPSEVDLRLEVDLLTDRLEAERQAHRATVEHYERTLEERHQ